MRKIFLSLSLFLFLYSVLSSANAADYFSGIGIIPGFQDSFIHKISKDGSTVIGEVSNHATTQAFRKKEKMELVSPQGWIYESGAFGVSDNGDIVVGTGLNSQLNIQGFVWKNSWKGSSAPLENPPGIQNSYAKEVSGDGGAIWGYGLKDAGGSEVITWSKNGKTIPTEQLVGYNVAVNDSFGKDFTGSISASAGKEEAFVWRRGKGYEQLSFQTEGVNSRASGISNAIVGMTEKDGKFSPFFWKNGEVAELPGRPPGWHGAANAVSDNGDIIVGSFWSGIYYAEAIFWKKTGNGYEPVNVRDFLLKKKIDLSDWWLISATSVSGDGETIAGNGIRISTASYEGWVAKL